MPEPSRRRQSALAIGCFVLFAAAVVWPTRGIYFWDGHEHFYPHYRTLQMVEAWRTGGGPAARWMGGACWGYGWPFFTFYAPFGYQVSALLNVIGLSIGPAVKVSFFLAFFLSGAFAGATGWLITRRDGSARPELWGLAAALITLAAPYHLVDLFVRSALAECWAWAAFVAALLALEIARTRPRSGGFAFALAVMLITISHNISAFYGVFVLGFYALATVQWSSAGLRWLLRIAAAGFLGILLAGWFWWPAVRLIPFVSASQLDQFHAAPEALRANALDWSQMFFRPWGENWGLAGDTSAALYPAFVEVFYGAVAFLLAAAGVVRGAARRRVFACSAIAFLLMLAMSRWMPWESTPQLMRYIQFPWRLHVFLISILAISLAAAGAPLERKITPWLFIVPPFLFGLWMLNDNLIQPPAEPMSDARIESWARERENRLGAPAGSIHTEFRPIWVPQKYTQSSWQRLNPPPPGRLVGLRAPVSVLEYRREGARHFWAVEAPQETHAEAFVFFFPGLDLLIDGNPAPDRLGRSSDGLVAILLPAGRHEIALAHGPTPEARTGRRITLAGLALLLGWFALEESRKRQRARTAVGEIPSRPEGEDESRQTDR